MVMRWAIVAVWLAAACGGSAQWSGKWKQDNPPPGASLEMTLTGEGTNIRGSGVELRDPAGSERTFTVAGTSQPVPGFGVTFNYSDNSTEGFTFAQPDVNHLTLAGLRRTLSFTRQ
jgi:hypothetical protein